MSVPPIRCGENDDLEVHILTSRSDFLDAVWCLKTFFFFSSQKAQLTIHDDGTLSDGQKHTLKHHFQGARILSRPEADTAMRKALKGRPFSTRYRFDNFVFHSIKLFDTLLLSRSKSVLLLDSDVLFFALPAQLDNCLAKKTGAFMSDYRNSYSIPAEEIRSLFSTGVPEHFNSGLLYIPDKVLFFEDELVERFLSIAFEKGLPHKYWLEQTAFALLCGKSTAPFERLNPEYGISSSPMDKNRVCHHYVTDGSRKAFYSMGLKRLREEGFIGLMRSSTVHAD